MERESRQPIQEFSRLNELLGGDKQVLARYKSGEHRGGSCSILRQENGTIVINFFNPTTGGNTTYSVSESEVGTRQLFKTAGLNRAVDAIPEGMTLSKLIDSLYDVRR